ncbi:MAG: YHYH protein [Pseudomonadota bacterium]
MNRGFAIVAGSLVFAMAVACQPRGPAGPTSNSAEAASAGTGEVEITKQGGEICIRSNGIPEHAIGQFPNRGNPHRVRAQRVDVCVPADPRKNSRAQSIRGSIGIAINGVTIRPGTADFYDPSSRRGFSRDRSSGWNLEGMGAAELLGLDQNNAHVDRRGLYHYHGSPTGLLPDLPDSMMGWAADGFELHIAPSGTSSSWRLKPGERPTPPYGRYDGTYVEDWEFAAGSGTLDECNGGMLNGRFVYFVTPTYPFYPRCLWGTPSRDFGRP